VTLSDTRLRKKIKSSHPSPDADAANSSYVREKLSKQARNRRNRKLKKLAQQDSQHTEPSSTGNSDALQSVNAFKTASSTGHLIAIPSENPVITVTVTPTPATKISKSPSIHLDIPTKEKYRHLCSEIRAAHCKKTLLSQSWSQAVLGDSPLEKLPNEIKHQVLAHLRNVSTLLSGVTRCISDHFIIQTACLG
jgi:hypothetical protein